MSTAGKAIKSRAAVAYGVNKPPVIEEIDVAAPKAHEIRVKIYASGINGDDHALSDEMESSKFPVVLGHEGSGIVESVGEGVNKVQPGDHVMLLSSPIAGKNDGLMLDKTSRFSIKGKMIYHFMSASTFSEYTVVNELAAVKIDKAAPLDQVCLVGWGFATGYRTVLNKAKVKPGSSCVVFGLGGIGMSAVMACKIAGAKQIIGVDNKPAKFKAAKELGCTECVNPDDHSKPIHEVITELTKGGADYGFECIGKVDMMASMIQATQPSYGSATIIGVPNIKDRLSLDVKWLLTGRTLQGAFLGDYKAPLDFPGIISDMLAGKINLSPLVSARLPLEKINEGFDLMRNGKTIRTVLLIGKQ